MTTPILQLDELEDSQSQPHVPLNASVRALEQYAQLLVLDQDLSAPPAAVDGDCYIVASGGSGAWSGWDNSIAYYSGGWLRIEPRVGIVAYVIDEDTYYNYTGSSPGGWEVWTHEQQGETARALASWYTSIVEQMNRQLDDIRRQLGHRDGGER